MPAECLAVADCTRGDLPVRVNVVPLCGLLLRGGCDMIHAGRSIPELAFTTPVRVCITCETPAPRKAVPSYAGDISVTLMNEGRRKRVVEEALTMVQEGAASDSAVSYTVVKQALTRKHGAAMFKSCKEEIQQLMKETAGDDTPRDEVRSEADRILEAEVRTAPVPPTHMRTCAAGPGLPPPLRRRREHRAGIAD